MGCFLLPREDMDLVEFPGFQFILRISNSFVYLCPLDVNNTIIQLFGFWPHVWPHAQTQETKEWATLTWTSTRQTEGG